MDYKDFESDLSFYNEYHPLEKYDKHVFNCLFLFIGLGIVFLFAGMVFWLVYGDAIIKLLKGGTE